MRIPPPQTLSAIGNEAPYAGRFEALFFGREARRCDHSRYCHAAHDRAAAGRRTIRVQYSSLNYKDALAAKGHPGVAPNLPHVPGIDAVGKVALSSDSRFVPGQIVLATS